MRTINTSVRTILAGLLLLVSTTASADIFYMCSGTTLSLTPSAAPAGMHYVLDVQLGGASISGYPLASVPATVSLPLSTAGEYTVTLSTVKDDPANTTICPPDPTAHTVNVLPALTLALAAPSAATYCSVATVNSSAIAAATGNFPTAFAADLGLEYRYAVEKDGNAPVDGATLGTIDQATGKYTLTTAVAGTYKITGYVKYKQTGTNGTLLGTTGCEVSSAATVQTITVTNKPAKPTITLAVN